MLRTFIAVKIYATSPLRKLLADLTSAGLRPAPADSLHVTLKFLGDTRDELIADVSRAVSQATQKEAAFHARLQGLGAFPHAQRPSVLWVGLREAEPLVRMAARLDESCAVLGFASESRPFSPHLTLLRFKSRPPQSIFEMLASETETDYGTARISEVVYFQSDLAKTGARHTALATVKLAP